MNEQEINILKDIAYQLSKISEQLEVMNAYTVGKHQGSE